MKFIADSMLGRLAKWLRLFGYDTAYFKGKSDSELIYESIKQRRVILTRDSRISKNKPLKIIFIKSERFTEQIRQVAKDLNIEFEKERYFTRCLGCNARLIKIEKEKVKDRVPAFIYKTQKIYSCCPNCEKIFWEGSHIQLAGELIKTL